MSGEKMRAQDILDYWFGALAEDGSWSPAQQKLWFGGGEALDKAIRERFGAVLEEVEAGGHKDWEQTPRGKLAIILLCDQLSRNVWRGQARAFSLDARSYALAQGMVASGEDEGLHLIERVFVYLPLEHHEGMEAQEASVALFTKLVEQAPAARRGPFESFLEYAISHRDIIAQFGRYPHRNEVLGRETSAEEAAFLKDGPRFGQ
jgi:uncharacterized protein (DUF924 family)